MLLTDVKRKYDDVTDIDVIGISFGAESWILIRASNTGPKIRITVEGESEEKAESLLKEFQDQIEVKLNSLK